MAFKEIVNWFKQNKRDLPWRQNRTFYRVWISEVMLQQTQVDTVIPYYERFLKRFPTIKHLAEAPLDDVLKHWEGLGYYSRARNLHKAAIDFEKNGTPDNYNDLISIIGFGPYITSAVLSLTLDLPHPVIDGNVKRVITRLYNIYQNIEKKPTLDKIQQILESNITSFSARVFNESIMEFGALICKPTNPYCDRCPTQKDCISYQQGTHLKLPNKPKKKKVPVKSKTIHIHFYNHKFIVNQREETEMLGGLWSLDSGSEINQDLKSLKFTLVKHQYTHFKLELHPIVVKLKVKPKLGSNQKLISMDEYKTYAFDKASIKVIEQLKSHYEKIISL